jgi:folate-binding protein YgfZ
MLLPLHEFHHNRGANFTTVNGAEVVADYGDPGGEYLALRETAGVIDLSCRSRLCLTGTDRVRFLHGQVTNDVNKLRAGEGCYSAITTSKGKMQSDLNIFCLEDELLLDFEPGLTTVVTERLEKYIVADDVQVVDVTPHYGLLSVQGPKAEAVVRALGLFTDVPATSLSFSKIADATLGEIYLINHARLAGSADVLLASSEIEPRETRQQDAGAAGGGFDLFVPTAALETVADQLIAAAKSVGGRAGGWSAFEGARIAAGVPRFGVDMDETNLASECGIEARAISYQKGCYIGQEVLNRIHSFGHVNRELRRLHLTVDLKTLPARGDKLFHGDKEVGHITSAITAPTGTGGRALGYVRREANAVGTQLTLRSGSGESVATII